MEPINRISNRLNVRAELHEDEQRLINRLSEKNNEDLKERDKKKDSDDSDQHDEGKGDYVDVDA